MPFLRKKIRQSTRFAQYQIVGEKFLVPKNEIEGLDKILYFSKNSKYCLWQTIMSFNDKEIYL